uniref:Sperm-associated antigen 6 n=1 Tax=Cacopsylla melanoneura TaxID=428564 RepID=A0A8D9BTN9_9HEMI
MASNRGVLNTMDCYQKGKINFLQGVHNYTLTKDMNIIQLLELNMMDELIPLLMDNSPHVQNLAVMTAARLCGSSQAIAESILENKVLKFIASVFECGWNEFRRNVLQLVINIGKYPSLTLDLLTQAGPMLKNSIHDLDTVQKEFTLIALTHIANHSVCNALHVMELQVLPHMLLCLQVPVNLALKCTQLIKALCMQSIDIAATLLDNDVLKFLADNLDTTDTKFVKQLFLCLAEIAKLSEEFAQRVLNTRPVLCKSILYLSHCDDTVKKSAAELLRELSRHHGEICRTIIQHGALIGLVNMVRDTSGMIRVNAVLTLGYMGAKSDHLALAIIHTNGLKEIIKALDTESNQDCLSAIVWTLEQLTKYSARHVSFLNADTNVFCKLVKLYSSSESSQEVKCRCLSALQNTINKCLVFQDIDLLLYDSAPEILLPVLKQLSKIFNVDLKARKVFLSTGGLKRVQALIDPHHTELCKAICEVNAYFPEKALLYYSMDMADRFVKKVRSKNILYFCIRIRIEYLK